MCVCMCRISNAIEHQGRDREEGEGGGGDGEGGGGIGEGGGGLGEGGGGDGEAGMGGGQRGGPRGAKGEAGANVHGRLTTGCIHRLENVKQQAETPAEAKKRQTDTSEEKPQVSGKVCGKTKSKRESMRENQK